MTGIRISRRTFATACTASLVTGAASRLAVTAQSTPSTTGDSLVAEISGTAFAWQAPWSLRPDKPLTEEVAILNADTEEELGTFTIDSIWLGDGAGADGATYVVIDPESQDVPTSWNWTIGWPEEEVTDFTGLEEEPAGSELDYGLAYLVHDGVPCGAFYTSRGITEDISQQRWFGAPVVTFAEQMASYNASMMIDGAEPFPGVDPAGLQAALEAHLASAGGTPESTPEP